MTQPIPFNRPCIVGSELRYIREAVDRGNIAGDGVFTQKCAELMQDRLGLAHVLMTPSATSALEMAAMLVDFRPGDEVIMPSFTFVSTANAFVRAGATPVFVDIRPDTLNMDEERLAAAITARTRAIVPVHYAGVACEMDRILQVARDQDLIVVEDAAHAIGATYHGRALGGLGDLGVFSFHETKNFTCGEGGALCVNNSSFLERAHILRDKGTNRQQFMQGQVDKYTWVDVGGSYVPSEVCCAFLYAQLEQMGTIQLRREKIFQRYQAALGELAQRGVLQLPVIPEGCQSSYHLFHLVLPDQTTRDRLLEYLTQRDIHAVFHYVPLHTSPMGRRVQPHAPPALPVTERISQCLLRLPMFLTLSQTDQQRVIDAVLAFFAA